MTTIIDTVRSEFESIFEFLSAQQQISMKSDAEKYFKKILILSAASYFEHEVRDILSQFVSKKSNGDERLINFLQKKAISTEYFKLFDWGEKDKIGSPGKSANGFFKLFGQTFRDECEQEVKKSPELDQSIKSFLEIGHIRNILAHSNFAAFNFENKTSSEIYSLFRSAESFIEYLKLKLC